MIKPTEYQRKVDKIGRLVIPSKLRNHLGIEPDKEYDFFIIEDSNRKFLAIEVYEGDYEAFIYKRKLREKGYIVVDPKSKEEEEDLYNPLPKKNGFGFI